MRGDTYGDFPHCYTHNLPLPRRARHRPAGLLRDPHLRVPLGVGTRLRVGIQARSASGDVEQVAGLGIGRGSGHGGVATACSGADIVRSSPRVHGLKRRDDHLYEAPVLGVCRFEVSAAIRCT